MIMVNDAICWKLSDQWGKVLQRFLRDIHAIFGNPFLWHVLDVIGDDCRICWSIAYFIRLIANSYKSWHFLFSSVNQWSYRVIMVMLIVKNYQFVTDSGIALGFMGEKVERKILALYWDTFVWIQILQIGIWCVFNCILMFCYKLTYNMF